MAILDPTVLKAAIKALIETVPLTGRVHTQRRIVRDDIQIKAHLWDNTNQRICGWFISPSRTNPVLNERNPGYVGHGILGGGNVLTTFQFQIEGLFAVNDAADSETVFSNLVYGVAKEFDKYGSIPLAGGGPVPGLHEQLPVSVEEFGYIMFAGHLLLHFARIEIGFRGRTWAGS